MALNRIHIRNSVKLGDKNLPEFIQQIEQDIFSKVNGNNPMHSDNTSDTFQSDSESVDEFLEQMYSDPEVRRLLDENSDSSIDGSEKSKFENFIKGNNSELTLDALKDAYASIKNGTFDKEAYKGYSGNQDENNLSNTISDLLSRISNPNSLASRGTSGAAPTGGGGSNPSSSSSDSGSSEITEGDLDSMSKSELEKAQADQKNELQEKENQLTTLMTDPSSDPDLAQLQKNIDDSYDAYREMLSDDQELQSRLDEMESQVNAQQADVDQKDLAVTNQEQAVSVAESQHEQAVASVASAQAAVNELSGESEEGMSDEEKESLADRKAQAQAQLEQAQAAEAAAAENLAAQEQQLTECQNALKESQQQLETLNTQKEQLDAEIVQKHPEVAQAQQDYNQAKTDFQSTKSEKVSNAKTEVKDAQNILNEIDTRLSEMNDYSNKMSLTTPGLFNQDIDMDFKYFKDKGYGVFYPKDVDPNEEKPVIVYLHGYHDGVEGEANLNSEAFVQELKNGDLANFDGYIICPVSPNGWNDPSATNRIDNAVNDFASTHAIDRNNISLVGHSMGGTGAIYQANAHLNGRNGIRFNKVAAISPQHSSGVDISQLSKQMGVRGYTGVSDVSYVRTQGLGFVEGVGSENVRVVEGGHVTAAQNSLLIDDNNDGISDLLQWLVTPDKPNTTKL